MNDLIVQIDSARRNRERSALKGFAATCKVQQQPEQARFAAIYFIDVLHLLSDREGEAGRSLHRRRRGKIERLAETKRIVKIQSEREISKFITLYFNSFCRPPYAKRLFILSNATCPIYDKFTQFTSLRRYELTWVCNLDSGSPRTRVPFLENDFRATRLSDTSCNGEHELQDDGKIFRT